MFYLKENLKAASFLIDLDFLLVQISLHFYKAPLFLTEWWERWKAVLSCLPSATVQKYAWQAQGKWKTKVTSKIEVEFHWENSQY